MELPRPAISAVDCKPPAARPPPLVAPLLAPLGVAPAATPLGGGAEDEVGYIAVAGGGGGGGGAGVRRPSTARSVRFAGPDGAALVAVAAPASPAASPAKRGGSGGGGGGGMRIRIGGGGGGGGALARPAPTPLVIDAAPPSPTFYAGGLAGFAGLFADAEGGASPVSVGPWGVFSGGLGRLAEPVPLPVTADDGRFHDAANDGLLWVLRSLEARARGSPPPPPPPHTATQRRRKRVSVKRP